MTDAAARSIFGLGVWSDTALPNLNQVPRTRQVDVRVWLTSTPRWLAELDSNATPVREWYVSGHQDEAGRPLLKTWLLDGGRYVRIQYREGTEFIIDRTGTHIAARWPSPWTVDDISSYLLGPILGLVLRLRGITTLHASAVRIEGCAVAFVGVEGSGKSTIAGALAAKGFPVLSDDMVPVEGGANGLLVHPGCPRVRLWPASAQAVSTIRPGEYWHKAFATPRRYNLDLLQHGYRFQADPLPLGAVYLLGTGDRHTSTLGLEVMTAQEALMGLVANTFANRLLDRAERGREFEFLADLVAAVPVRRLCNGGSMDRLSELSDAVVADATRSLRPDHIDDGHAAAALSRPDAPQLVRA